MKRMALIAASSIAALAATFAVAQPQPVPPAGGGGDRDGQRQERSESREQRREEWRERRAERAQNRLNERFARLREEMKLKPEQTALFDSVETLVKKRFEERRERWSEMREQRQNLRHADIMERLDAMSTRLAERAARSKELADAVRPLWATLSDEQKTVTRRAMREVMAEGRERMRGMRGGWEHHRGYDDDERGHRRWRDRDDD